MSAAGSGRRGSSAAGGDLLDPALDDETILTIASRWGLPGPQHFSRLFRSAVRLLAERPQARAAQRRLLSIASGAGPMTPGPEGDGDLGPVRRRACGRRRRPRGRRGPAGRPDRPERRRQDDVHRRDQRFRPLRRAGRARRRGPDRAVAARPRAARPRADVAVDRAVRRPLRGREPARRLAPSVCLADDPGDGLAARSARGRDRTRPGAARARGRSVEQLPSELSQGQRKLVGIARALAPKPRVVCLDEPAAGLDTHESEELGARLRGLADDGQAMLLVDHDMGLVLGICDEVVVLEFGEVIARGAARRRSQRPAGDRRLPRRCAPRGSPPARRPVADAGARRRGADRGI